MIGRSTYLPHVADAGPLSTRTYTRLPARVILGVCEKINACMLVCLLCAGQPGSVGHAAKSGQFEGQFSWVKYDPTAVKGLYFYGRIFINLNFYGRLLINSLTRTIVENWQIWVSANQKRWCPGALSGHPSTWRRNCSLPYMTTRWMSMRLASSSGTSVRVISSCRSISNAAEVKRCWNIKSLKARIVYLLDNLE